MRFPAPHDLYAALKPIRRRLRGRWLSSTGRRQEGVVELARSVPGMFHREEIRLLYRTVRASRPPGDIAEIGSWKGRSTVVMGLALRDSGDTSCRIYAVDPHVGSEEHRDVIEREGSTLPAFSHNVRTLGVDALVEPVVEYSTRAASVLAARGVSLRLLFIDGAHDEESVRADIRAFLPLVRPGGTIALHDCGPDTGWPGVWAAYRSELAPFVAEVERAHSLLVTRLPAEA